MNPLRHPALHLALGLVLGGFFLYASREKVLQPAEFARIVYHYQVIGPSQLLPPLVANTLAVTLPWIELLAGLGLVTGFWRREAALVTGALLVVFILAVASTMLRGIDVQNCGCFSLGPEGRKAGALLILGDACLLAAAWVLAFFPPQATAPAGAPRDAAGEPR